jgi:hypothetical protein
MWLILNQLEEKAKKVKGNRVTESAAVWREL